MHQWSTGNIGEAYRSLSSSDSLIRAQRDAEPLRHRLQLLTPVMLALNTALHGDLVSARAMFDTAQAEAGDDPYAASIWASFSVTAAAVAGDPVWALRASEAAIALDPDFAFSFSGSYLRLGRAWARAMTGDDPGAAAAEVQHMIETFLLQPPRSNLATWHALLAELHVAAGDTRSAEAAIGRAETLIEIHGERYAEGLVLLMRARTLQARGVAVAAVRAAALDARDLSAGRGAHLFAVRAEKLLAELG